MGSQGGWVLRCRGLPYSITKSEIENFFDTSTLATTTEESVQITYNEEGKSVGMDKVIFGFWSASNSPEIC